MNKSDLIDAVAIQLTSSKAQAGKAVDAVLENIAKGLDQAGGVQLKGFGNFEIRTRAARKGRNPSTGAELAIPESHTVGFKPAKALKDAVSA